MNRHIRALNESLVWSFCGDDCPANATVCDPKDADCEACLREYIDYVKAERERMYLRQSDASDRLREITGKLESTTDSRPKPIDLPTTTKDAGEPDPSIEGPPNIQYRDWAMASSSRREPALWGLFIGWCIGSFVGFFVGSFLQLKAVQAEQDQPTPTPTESPSDD